MAIGNQHLYMNLGMQRIQKQLACVVPCGNIKTKNKAVHSNYSGDCIFVVNTRFCYPNSSAWRIDFGFTVFLVNEFH